MPEPRINPDHVRALKSWMSKHRAALSEYGIDRIHALYTDDDLSIGAFDEFQAYHVEGPDATLTRVPLEKGDELRELIEILEPIADEDGFFLGCQGNGGTIRLLLSEDAIHHASFEYVTDREEHDVEIY